jgi:hypothetical protein
MSISMTEQTTTQPPTAIIKVKARRSGGGSKARNEEGLTPKQELFVQQYTRSGFNLTRACERANIDNSSAFKMIRLPAVKRAVEMRLAEHGITRERVVAELAAIAFKTDAADFEPLLDGKKKLVELRESGVDTRLLKSVSKIRGGKGGKGGVKIEMVDRQAALEKLAKALGVYSDGVQVNIITPEAMIADLERLGRCIETGERPPADFVFDNDPE